MEDNVVMNELTEIVSSEQQAVEAAEQPQPVVEAPKQEPKEDYHEKNYRALRDARYQAERERDEALRILQQYQQKQQEPEEDLSVSVQENEYVEGKHLSKVDKKIRRLEQKLQEAEKRSFEYSIEAQVKSQYPDYDRVVNNDTLQRLVAEHPDIAQTLASSTDLKARALATYKMINKLGIIPTNSFDYEKQIAQRNMSKPKPVASVAPQQGESPLSKANAFANGLTPELQEELRKEMFQAMRSR